MMRRLPLVVWLTVVWVALWGGLGVGNVVSGVVVASVLVVLFRFPIPSSPASVVRPFRAIAFLVFFVWKLVEASAIVAWEVVTPRNRINEAIIAVPIHGASDALATIVANFITLTPGTLTLEFERAPSVLYIHVLHLRNIEAVRRDVQRLERIAIRAFGSADALRTLEPGGDYRVGGSADLHQEDR